MKLKYGLMIWWRFVGKKRWKSAYVVDNPHYRMVSLGDRDAERATFVTIRYDGKSHPVCISDIQWTERK